MDRQLIAKSISDHINGLSYQDVLKYPGNIVFSKFSNGTILMEPGNFSKDLFFIKKGIIRAYHESEDNQQKTIFIRVENEFFGDYYSIILDTPTRLYYECLEDCEFYKFEFGEIEQYLKQNTEVMNFAFQYLAKVVSEYIARNEDFIFLSAEERYIKYVLNNKSLLDRVPAKLISSMLGVTPVSLSRIKKRIQDKENPS